MSRSGRSSITPPPFSTENTEDVDAAFDEPISDDTLGALANIWLRLLEMRSMKIHFTVKSKIKTSFLKKITTMQVLSDQYNQIER